MPYRKSYRRRKRKFRRKRRYGRKRKMRRKNRMAYGITRNLIAPDSQYVKMKIYHVENILGLTADGVTVLGNSLFDPLLTLGSQQPAGFDQWATIYSHYQVTGSSCKITFINHAASQFRLALLPQLTTTNPGIVGAATQPYSKNIIISSQEAGGIRSLSNFMRTKKLIGRSTDSVNFGAAVTANPSKLWYWLARIASTDGVTTIDAQILIEMTFYAKFYERHTLADA